jgi:WD40 repeat protein
VSNAEKVRVIRELPRDASEMVWMRNGQLALHGWEESVEVLHPVSLRPVRKIAQRKRLVHFAASADGQSIAFCENTSSVEVHNLRSDKELQLETNNAQPSIAFSPDGKLLATGGYGTRAKLWSTTAGKLVRCLEAPGEGGLTTVFSPDGMLLAVGNRNDVTRLFEVQTGRLVHTLPRPMSHELKFSPDGRRLAVAYVNGSVALWDASSGKLLIERKVDAEEIYTLDWSPAGDVLVTAGLKGKITLWEGQKLSVLRELSAPEWVIRARFSPDGRRLFTARGAQSSTDTRKVSVWGIEGR